MRLLAALSFGIVSLAADRDPFDLYLCDINILQDKGIQAELKVGEAQRAKLNEHATWFDEEAKRIESNAAADSRVELLLTARAVFKARVLDSLSDPQVKRLAQLSLRAMDIVAVLDLEIGKKLGITEVQQKKLFDEWKKTGEAVAAALARVRKPIVEKYRAKTADSDGERKALQAEMAKEIAETDKTIQDEIQGHKKAFEATVAKTLSDGQKKEWERLKGPPMSKSPSDGT
ncbi:MAG: hypothetical protein AB7F50_06875 [Fimbriimonadaceae bacterium]